MINIINAQRACNIADSVHEVEKQLEIIDDAIIKQAEKGEYYVFLYPETPFHSRTILILKELGYNIFVNEEDEAKGYYEYKIFWGNIYVKC